MQAGRRAGTSYHRGLAAVVALALVAAACGGSSSKAKSSTTTSGVSTKTTNAVATRTVTVWPLAFVDSTPPKGISTRLDVQMGPSPDQKLRVNFSEDEVSGTGDQWRAAAWSAVTVATLLTGSPLRGRQFTFQLRGRIDGPSAGTLMTIAVVSLIRGDKIKPDITMTGTINPDGTVGPVGGIPYKVQGVVQAGKSRMLIPIGQRNSPDNSGKNVDIVQEGRTRNIAVSETADIYDAYKQFTGVDLPRPGQPGTVSLSERAYQNLKAKADENIAQVKSDAANINVLPSTIRSALSSTLQQAQSEVTQANKLETEGLQAGAFNSAAQAALSSSAALKTGTLLETYFTKGAAAFVTQLNGSVAINEKLTALFETLKAFAPASISDVSALIAAYANGTDALSLSNYGDNVLSTIKSARTTTEALQIALKGAFLKEAALGVINYAKDVFDVGRGLGGPALQGTADVAGTADFFRKAAEANLTAFNTVVVDSAANQAGISNDQATARFENNDLQYALANSSVDVIEGGIDKFLEAGAADYARLGAAVSLYVRSAGLLDKYYSLQAQLDANGNVTQVFDDQALSNALDLAKTQVERSVSLLTGRKIDPTIEIGGYEIAGIEREGTTDDKLTALEDYRSAFLTSRIIAYLAGFANEGFN